MLHQLYRCVCVWGGDIRYNGLYGEAPFDRRRDFAPVKYNLWTFFPWKGGEGGGGLLEDLWYTCIHILKDVNKRGTFFVKNGMKKKL